PGGLETTGPPLHARRFRQVCRAGVVGVRRGDHRAAVRWEGWVTEDPFDKGARYLAKHDPPRFFQWLIPGLEGVLAFQDWVDTRLPRDPKQGCWTAAPTANSGRWLLANRVETYKATARP